MSEFKLKTPIAFIVFNRPNTTERVFAEIAKVKPSKLLVVGDGARTHKPGEAEKVAATRAIIDRVDWDCQVLTNYSKINLGCKVREASGIDWIFEQVEEAIILEDDCLPHPTFFRYCEELLNVYRNDQRIAMISGNNFQPGFQVSHESYYFSNYTHGWGWATWRDRWQKDYDVEMKDWPRIRDEGRIAKWFNSTVEQKYWSNTFEKVYRGKIDTYDYQWFFAVLLNGRNSILPNVNLISNIGFGSEATHTTNISPMANLPVKEMLFPLKHPKEMVVAHSSDRYFFNKFCFVPWHRRVINKLARLLKI